MGNFSSSPSFLFISQQEKKNNMQDSFFDTTSFVFDPIELNSAEAFKLIHRQYTKKQTGEKRFDSMLHFLCFSCMCSNYRERRSFSFLQHVLHAYNAQEGRCAISGRPLQRPLVFTHGDPRFFASIDRLDNKKGYEIGNIRLTLEWLNHAMGNQKRLEDVIHMGAILCLEKVLSNQKHFIEKYELKPAT